MLNKFFKFFKGYVIIEIYGKNPERFINICLRRKIDVGSVLPTSGGMTFEVLNDDFKRLREIRSKTGLKLRIIKKRGLKNTVRRFRKRLIFVICAILCAAAIYNISQHIWTVEINGVKKSDINTLVSQLEENGIKVGADKRKLKSIGEIKQNILLHNDEIAWLWVYFDGTKARVEVSEIRVPHKTEDRKTPCDIAAVREGVVKDVTVKNGEAKVMRGDAVDVGDILISGKVTAFREGYEEKYVYVHALGTVTAYTTHTAVGEGKLYNEKREPTGRVKYYPTLEIFGKRFDLYTNKKNTYKDYDVKTVCHEAVIPFFGSMGISLTIEKNIEVSVKRYTIDEKTAAEKVRDTLEEEIAKELTLFAELESSSFEYEKIDDETIKVICTMNFTERIGEERSD